MYISTYNPKNRNNYLININLFFYIAMDTIIPKFTTIFLRSDQSLLQTHISASEKVIAANGGALTG
jgi:hypothetical protein